MAQVIIRNLDDAVVRRLKSKAKAQGTSVEGMLRDVVTTLVRRDRSAMIEELQRVRALSPRLPAGAPLAEDLIREDRDDPDR
jgi:plasmid stability protein